MANKFVRNITNVRNIEKQEKVTNNQNDLLSDKNHAYIRNNNEYHPLTDNIKTINGMEVDKDNNKNAVSIAVKENGGEVPFTVNGQQLTFDTGNQVKTIQGLPPLASGDFTIQIKQNEEFVPYENIDDGEVIFDLGQVVTSINGNAPDSNGNINVSGGGGGGAPTAIFRNLMVGMSWTITLAGNLEIVTESEISRTFLGKVSKVQGHSINVDNSVNGYTVLNIFVPETELFGQLTLHLGVTLPDDSSTVLDIPNPVLTDAYGMTGVYKGYFKDTDSGNNKALFFNRDIPYTFMFNGTQVPFAEEVILMMNDCCYFVDEEGNVLWSMVGISQ